MKRGKRDTWQRSRQIGEGDPHGTWAHVGAKPNRAQRREILRDLKRRRKRGGAS